MLQNDSENNNVPRLPSIPRWLAILIFALLYLLTARLGLLFVLKPEGIASIWPVSGLAFAALLLAGDKDRNKYIAAIFAANFLANIAGGNTVITSLGFAAANTAEPVLGRLTFIQIAGKYKGLNNLTEVGGVCASAILANGLTAFLGAAIPALAFGAPYWQTWELWWIADGLGILIVAPFILAWSDFRRTALPLLTISRLAEVMAMLVLTLAITLGISGIISGGR